MVPEKSPRLSTHKGYEFKHRIMNEGRIEHSPDLANLEEVRQ